MGARGQDGVHIAFKRYLQNIAYIRYLANIGYDR